MKEFITKINKYIILIIIQSISGMPWIYLRNFILEIPYSGEESIIDYVPTIITYSIKLIIIILLIIDFRKENLKFMILSCITVLFFPLLGVVIFSLLLLEKELKSANV